MARHFVGLQRPSARLDNKLMAATVAVLVVVGIAIVTVWRHQGTRRGLWYFLTLLPLWLALAASSASPFVLGQRIAGLVSLAFILVGLATVSPWSPWMRYLEREQRGERLARWLNLDQDFFRS